MYKYLLMLCLSLPCFLLLRSRPDQPFESLKGIDSVGIIIVGLDRTSAQYGLLETEIADETAAFLKKYGITP
jgi:hypothetical protein